MSQSTSVASNLSQTRLISNNPEEPRTVTVKCLVRDCTKKWFNQMVNQATSNYYAHFRHPHKDINLEAIKNKIDPKTIIPDPTQGSSQLSLEQSFASNSQSQEFIETIFQVVHFKRLLLNFLVSNNISFRAVTSTSFRKLMAYLHKEVPALYSQVLTDELTTYFINDKALLKDEFIKQKKSQGGFSLTLDAWTAINQDTYLGITV
ncbi:hypothetical protein DL95DRAFT_451759 [Leptodontidium sp. 2 PMI_412]|nr:hypothetical protein DL95DRAFT_451759 [Leptodontidium sp. 2 PMI_412]